MFPERGDDFENELLFSAKQMTFSILIVLVLIFGLSLLGCVSAPVAPNLRLPEQKACASIALPPVPDHGKLVINGNDIDADAGGEQLLRGYVASRYVFQSAGVK